MTSTEWILIGVLIAVYLATAVRAATAARRLGRRPWLWLAITLCCTAVPTMVVFYRDAMRRHRQRAASGMGVPPMPHAGVTRTGGTPATQPGGAAMFRCPHCQTLIDPDQLAGTPLQTCPRCHLQIQKDTLA